MPTLLNVPTQNSIQYTLDAQISAGATSLTLNQSVAGIVQAPGTLVVDRIDSSGSVTATKREYISFTGVSTATISGLSRGLAGSTGQVHSVGAIVEFVPDIVWAQAVYDTITAEHNTDGSHNKVTGMANNTAVTQKNAAGTAKNIVKLNSNNVLEVGVTGTSALNDLYLTDSGSANAYTVTCDPVPVAYATGMRITFKATNANTTASTLNVNSLGTKTIKRYGTTDLSSGDISAGQIITVVYDGTNFLLQGSPLFTSGTTMDFSAFNGPEALAINGQIVTSVSSNNITVALKGLDGNDPSGSNKVYVRIGNTIRTVSAALSVTKNAGTNWFNSGAAELATLEIDYFIYLGYNATDGVVLGFARIPNARFYSDFSTTTTNSKYCAISTITNAVSTDVYENIGRFNAILSATAAFNWSIPGTSIIINRPIFETRWLSWAPTWTGFSAAPTYSVKQYKIRSDECWMKLKNVGLGTSNASTMTMVAPFPVLAGSGTYGENDFPITDNSIVAGASGSIVSTTGSSTFTCYSTHANNAWTGSGSKAINSLDYQYQI